MKGSDFGTLPSEDDYARYFNLLSRVFTMFISVYALRQAGETYEAERVPSFLRRLLKVVEALRLKYTYRRLDRALWVDFTDSGLPNFVEINNLSIDLLQKDEALRRLPPRSHLMKMALDLLLRDCREPEQTLQQLSERTFYEMLEEQSLFLPFAFGELSLRGEKDGSRQYLCTWGCYDQAENLPFIHLMLFDQDMSEAPLHQPGRTQDDFLKVLCFEGGHAQDVGFIALAIDDALDWIHPKMLKRLRVGPLYAPLLFGASQERTEESEAQRMVRELLAKYGRNENDFILCFKEEMVVSERQERVQSLLRPLKGRVREVFSFPEIDFECSERHASAIKRNAILPHRVLQHLDDKTRQLIPDFGRAETLLSYNEKGELNGHQP